MTTSARRIIALGCFTAALAVVLGAFGAHALKDILTEQRLGTFHTAVRYQFYHAFALLVAGGVYHVTANAKAVLAAKIFGVGLVVFCGSLYALVATDIGLLGAITPIGGVAFIAAWSLLGWCVLNSDGPPEGR